MGLRGAPHPTAETVLVCRAVLLAQAGDLGVQLVQLLRVHLLADLHQDVGVLLLQIRTGCRPTKAGKRIEGAISHPQLRRKNINFLVVCCC